ncbi:MAG: hypothetical protein AABX61_03300 [Nanoarchaeota archaeon]
MKKWGIYIFIIFVLALGVFAYSKDKGLEWLKNNADWTNGAIEDNAFTLLALKSNNYDTSNGYNVMVQRKDPSNCYPNGNCNVKDTALAALALKFLNYDTKPLLGWLNSALTRADVKNWYIQINTDKSGNCSITYDSNQVKKAFVNSTQKIKIENRQINEDWINVEQDLGVVLDQPIEQIKVDCTQVNDPSIGISLLRIIKGTDFYIIQESQSSISNLVINNACYPSYVGGQCDKESSFYAAYSLKKMNEDVKVTSYLLDKADNNLNNAMLYTITNNQKYIDSLIANQNPAGYWDNEDIYTTSFAINALKSTQHKDEFNNATQWLKSKQITGDLVNNGSFGNVRDTAVALYLGLTDTISTSGGGGGNEICGDNIIETGEECDDGNNINGDDCSSICTNENSNKSCIGDVDCSFGEKCISQVCVISECTNDQGCPQNEYCDTFSKTCKSRVVKAECGDGICSKTEDEFSCAQDCFINQTSNNEKICGNNICDVGEDSQSCPIDCGEAEKSNALFWISLIIIILILGGGGYFAYTKFFKKPKGNKFTPDYSYGETPKKQQSQQVYPKKQGYSRKKDVDESLEDELDKSIREAEKLLRK